MEEAAEYYIDSVLQSVADPAVDGTFVDDIGFGGEHAQMLITGLDRAATRGLALMALKRMPPDVVLPQVFMGLRGSDDDAPGRRIHLLLLAEAIGGDAIAHVIAGQMNASAVAVRRVAARPAGLTPPHPRHGTGLHVCGARV
mgnify:CR=1 FL=1